LSASASLAKGGARAVARGEWAALAVYAAVVVALLGASAAMALDILDQRASLTESQDALARLERSTRSGVANAPAGHAAAEATPFLTGPTITIGGAALQARVEAAARKVGALMLSSELDLQGSRAREGFIAASESLEVAQANLQPLLYDLEAGTPYLFVDNLEIESPQAFGEAEGARMRVKIGVTGQWRKSK
jgi:general secretion pathway protein M